MARPDFTGEWLLNKEASTLSLGANTAQSSRWLIEPGEPVFHHKGSFVFETSARDYGSAGTMTVSFRYELIDDGRRIRASEQVRGASWDQDNVWIFERR